VIQPVVEVSPPKWHLAHTTWFFETFVLKTSVKDFKEFDSNYNFLFNSYYEALGDRLIRADRGNLSRPSVADIYRYRRYIDEQMNIFLREPLSDETQALVLLGLNHEQQHQELLLTDIKYILGHNPLFPPYSNTYDHINYNSCNQEYKSIKEGLYYIGFEGGSFCFDNELGKHRVFLQDFQISSTLVTNLQFLNFIEDGGYTKFKFWHLEGWEWVKQNEIKAPLYWYLIDEKWHNYTLQGLKELAPNEPVSHINYYEAHAYAEWAAKRLPTEFEWEAASSEINWGKRWEWTESAYLPYPGFKTDDGAIGEYNGKFMINQMVLRGASDYTSPYHSRSTYRNFFHPHLRWQNTGIRLAE